MIYLAIAAVILAFLVLVGQKPRGTLKWRVVSALFSLVSAAGGVFVLMEGSWLAGLGLMAAAAYLGYPGQKPRATPGPPPPDPNAMALSEARAMLGVGEGASREEIETAYRRLMKRVHPDHGGAPGLASKLNAARDVLLKSRR